MDRDDYELFEYRVDGCLNWRGLVHGLESARVTLWLLADQLGHECFAMDSTTNRIRLARTPLAGAKRVFQVDYGKELRDRARLLRRDGYDVTSALGNEVAKHVLRMRPPFDLFVMGHMAPEQERLDMVHWLRVNYPNNRIVALNRPQSRGLDELRYNAPSEPVSAWLPLVSQAVGRSIHAPA